MLRTTLGFTAGLFLAFMAAVHDPAVQGIMGWRPAAGASASAGGGCPFGYDEPRTASTSSTPSMVAISKHLAARARVSMLASASERPALGFDLGTTTRADVLTWATQHGVGCELLRDRSSLECQSVPAGALASDPAQLASSTAWFEFSDDRLVRIKTLRRSDAAPLIENAFARTQQDLTERAGAPTAVAGRPELLQRGALRQTSAEFSYRDYVASVRATNMGQDGYVLTESYAAR